MPSPGSRYGIIFGIISVLLLALGSLIFFEYLRPFRSNDMDMPIAIALSVASASLSSFAVFFKKGAAALNLVVLFLNLLALCGVAILFQALSHMKLM